MAKTQYQPIVICRWYNYSAIFQIPKLYHSFSRISKVLVGETCKFDIEVIFKAKYNSMYFIGLYLSQQHADQYQVFAL